MKFPTFLHIATEGWGLILLITLGAMTAMALGASNLSLLVAGLILLAVAAYFREPDRRVPPYPLGIISPADGRIVHRRECHDPYLDRAAIRIGIELDRFGAYYFRAPIEGTLLEVRRTQQSPDAGLASWIQTDERDDIVMVISDGLALGARVCEQPYGHRVGQGRRSGRRRLIRRVDLYLPAESRVEVDIGAHVCAGRDRIATLVHNSVQSAPLESLEKPA